MLKPSISISRRYINFSCISCTVFRLPADLVMSADLERIVIITGCSSGAELIFAYYSAILMISHVYWS